MIEHETLQYTKGSRNVFADLGLKNPEQLLTRARLGFALMNLIAERKFSTQKKLAELLEIDKSEASKLAKGEMMRFSTERLMGFLNKLGYSVTLTIAPLQEGAEPQQVVRTDDPS